tara:strand:- start:2264 stop:3430 length:1167 start_codon:yes stop_codon:yes gene_type:complete
MKENILAKYKAAAQTGKPYSWLNYQPINLPGYEETVPLRGRDCFNRSEAILNHLDTVVENPERMSIVDWGSNLGFFCFEAARKGYKASGVDENKEFVDICSFLSSDTKLPLQHKPEFFLDSLNKDNISKYPADIAFCFSVLHHIVAKDRGKAWRLMDAFAEAYPMAYIEMDGADFGRCDLSLFYFNISEIAESNDRYGSSTKTRKTLYCSNIDNGTKYSTLKKVNKVHYRDIFKKTSPNGDSTVVKREEVNRFRDGYSHTWIKTNLSHEKHIYEKFKSDIFPKIISWNTGDKYNELEMEYFEREGEITLEGLNNVYSSLKENNLFIIDLVRDMFIPTKNGLKLVDVESVFEIEGDIENTIQKNIKQTKRTPYDSYEKQINVIKQIYKL